MGYKALSELSNDELEALARARCNPYYLTLRKDCAKLAQAGDTAPRHNADTSKECGSCHE